MTQWITRPDILPLLKISAILMTTDLLPNYNDQQARFKAIMEFVKSEYVTQLEQSPRDGSLPPGRNMPV